ncbi:MAG: TetR/AcrR family transcriptional regulator [Janthinobacterium lividum]
MTTKTTLKAQQTKEHILETALSLFANKGYPETTMRDIAAAADCSLGLAYRYFSRKEEFILALYERLAGELEEEVSLLPPMPLARRFTAAVEADLRRLGLHRQTMGALFAAGLAPDSEVAVLGDGVAGIRTRIWGIFRTVVTGASDAPRRGQIEAMTTLLYAAHLLFVLFWLQDRSADQSKTHELLAFAQQMLGRLRPVLGLPPVAKPLAKLAEIVGPMFGPTPVPTDGSQDGAGSDESSLENENVPSGLDE